VGSFSQSDYSVADMHQSFTALKAKNVHFKTYLRIK